MRKQFILGILLALCSCFALAAPLKITVINGIKNDTIAPVWFLEFSNGSVKQVKVAANQKRKLLTIPNSQGNLKLSYIRVHGCVALTVNPPAGDSSYILKRSSQYPSPACYVERVKN